MNYISKLKNLIKNQKMISKELFNNFNEKQIEKIQTENWWQKKGTGKVYFFLKRIF